MAIYVTGDSHGSLNIKKLSSKQFPEGTKLTKDDYVIITGDFGLIWDWKASSEDKYWLKWLENKPFTTLFVDGNHENHDKLDSLPVEEWCGGKIHRISDSVIHLMRGQVYTINDKKIFTFGGASSIDKLHRQEGISWWARELPSTSEYNEGLDNLDKHNQEVDYIFTHTCPIQCFDRVIENNKMHDSVIHYLGEIYRNIKYKHWYFGHFHTDKQLDDQHSVVYNEIIKIC